jgi:hypothetical protein
MEKNNIFDTFDSAYDEFLRRFANGEQYISVEKFCKNSNECQWVIEEEFKRYYWQNNSVFNHILPLVELSKQKGIKEEDIYKRNGLVDRLVPIQRAYNAVKNRELEYINRIAMGVMFVEDGSVDIDMIQEEGVSPGQVIVYRQGANIPQIDSVGCHTKGFVDTGNNLLKEMNLITQSFIVTHGGDAEIKLV